VDAESLRKLVLRAWDDEELAQEYFEAEVTAAMNRRKSQGS